MRLNAFAEANANDSWGFIGMALSCDGQTFSSLTKLTKMRIEYENRPSDVPVDGLAVRVYTTQGHGPDILKRTFYARCPRIVWTITTPTVKRTSSLISPPLTP